MLQDVQKIAEKMGNRMVTATVDEWGVVNLGAEFVVDVTDDAVYYCKFPGSRTVVNIQSNPKGAFAVIDWNAMKGFQVKGFLNVVTDYVPQSDYAKANYSKMMSLGANQVIKMTVAEIFDVIPKDNQLEALWRNESVFVDYVSTKIKYAPFKKPIHEPFKLGVFKSSLNNNIQELLKNRFNSFVGTVETNGSPNVSPRFVLEAADDYLLWGDKFKNKTFVNFSRPSPITVAMIDWNQLTGYQVKGWGTFHFFGESITKVNNYWKPFGIKDPFQAVHFRVEELDQLTLGPNKKLIYVRPRNEWAGMPSYQPKAGISSIAATPSVTSAPPSVKPENASVSAAKAFELFLLGGHLELESRIENIFKPSPVTIIRETITDTSNTHFDNLKLQSSLTVQHAVITTLVSQHMKSDYDVLTSVNQVMKYVRSVMNSSIRNLDKLIILLPEHKADDHFLRAVDLLGSYIKTEIRAAERHTSVLFISVSQINKLTDEQFYLIFRKSIYSLLNASFLRNTSYFSLDAEAGHDLIQDVVQNTHSKTT